MSNQAKILAKLRQAEIAKKSKAQALHRSGYTTSQMTSLFKVDRMIECNHYLKTGRAASLSYEKELLAKARKELKEAQGQVFRSVKRQGKKTVSVIEKVMPK